MATKFGGIVVGQFDSDQEILEAGFSLDKGEGVESLDFVCPHCGVPINGKEDVVLMGDSSCVKCNRPLFEGESSTPLEREDTDTIVREEFSAYWGEVFNPEEGDMDYDVD